VTAPWQEDETDQFTNKVHSGYRNHWISWRTQPMRTTFLFLTFGVLFGSAATSFAGPEDSVIKVLATQRMPNPLRPWANGTPNDVMGSGAVI
jgi:hypothetical protein